MKTPTKSVMNFPNIPRSGGTSTGGSGRIVTKANIGKDIGGMGARRIDGLEDVIGDAKCLSDVNDLRKTNFIKGEAPMKGGDASGLVGDTMDCAGSALGCISGALGLTLGDELMGNDAFNAFDGGSSARSGEIEGRQSNDGGHKGDVSNTLGGVSNKLGDASFVAGLGLGDASFAEGTEVSWSVGDDHGVTLVLRGCQVAMLGAPVGDALIKVMQATRGDANDQAS
ncbi:unnamed protein product [Ilex paraguariensis]|uniref:Uncharacterized protein n=1 Tax=Ilex paraguariensis TaxID=185542 RepID=A0ABC8RJA0_9AQUA